MNYREELDRASHWVRFACDQTWFFNGTETIDPELVIIKFSKRMTLAMGRARVHDVGGHDEYSIKLSYPLWPRASATERKNTIIHEACHLIDYRKHERMNHGRNWKHLMCLCGETPSRCHHVDTTGLKRLRKRHEFTCGCGPYRFTGPTKAKRIKQGSLYVCKACNQDVSLTGKVVCI